LTCIKSPLRHVIRHLNHNSSCSIPHPLFTKMPLLHQGEARNNRASHRSSPGSRRKGPQNVEKPRSVPQSLIAFRVWPIAGHHAGLKSSRNLLRNSQLSIMQRPWLPRSLLRNLLGEEGKWGGLLYRGVDRFGFAFWLTLLTCFYTSILCTRIPTIPQSLRATTLPRDPQKALIDRHDLRIRSYA
jgi:hypothetical protein